MRYFKISEDQLRDFIEKSNLLDTLRTYGIEGNEDYEIVFNDTDTKATEEDLSKFEFIKDDEQ
jgi:hypothetical protein